MLVVKISKADQEHRKRALNARCVVPTPFMPGVPTAQSAGERPSTAQIYGTTRMHAKLFYASGPNVGEPFRAHVVGPRFSSPMDSTNLRLSMDRHADFPLTTRVRSDRLPTESRPSIANLTLSVESHARRIFGALPP